MTRTWATTGAFGVTTFTIRGFDPIERAFDHGRTLLPATCRSIAIEQTKRTTKGALRPPPNGQSSVAMRTKPPMRATKLGETAEKTERTIVNLIGLMYKFRSSSRMG
jgi:hypothetical protein